MHGSDNIACREFDRKTLADLGEDGRIMLSWIVEK
jgi:hypothetical protein